MYCLNYCTTACVHPLLIYFSRYWNESPKSHTTQASLVLGPMYVSMMPLWLPLVLLAISNKHFHPWCGNMWNDGEATITPQSHQIKFKILSKLAQAVMIIILGKCSLQILAGTPNVRYPKLAITAPFIPFPICYWW